MEKEKPPGHGPGGGLPPPSPRHVARPVSASGGGDFSVKAEASPSSPAPGEDESAWFSHDVSRMLDFPRRKPGHRRAHSEILGLPDDISFDHDFGVVGSADGPSLSDDIEEDSFSMYIDTEKFPSPETSGLMAMQGGESSVTTGGVIGAAYGDCMGSGSNGRPKVRHQHSQSMDGKSSIKSELLTSVGEGTNLTDTKKALFAAKLADLTLIDPKRAKRILANRQSAARSKERKMRYISELERKVQTLQKEATTLSAQLTLLQRDSDGLTAENNELKVRLQTMEQQAHLQDALTDALREEVQSLKLMTGQVVSNGNQIINFGSSYGSTPQFYAHNHSVQSLLAAQQLQQLQIHSQHQQQPHSYQNHGSQQASINIKIREPTSSESQNQNKQDPDLDNSKR